MTGRGRGVFAPGYAVERAFFELTAAWQHFAGVLAHEAAQLDEPELRRTLAGLEGLSVQLAYVASGETLPAAAPPVPVSRAPGEGGGPGLTSPRLERKARRLSQTP